jgi:hypothetical protein
MTTAELRNSREQKHRREIGRRPGRGAGVRAVTGPLRYDRAALYSPMVLRELERKGTLTIRNVGC